MQLVLSSTVLILLLLNAWAAEVSQLSPLSDDLVNYINNHPSSTWKASTSTRFKTVQDAEALLGGLEEPLELRKSRRETRRHQIPNDLPIEFDAREAWSECPGISEVWDQSSCGSCWAFGAVSAMSDRMCIHANRTVHISASDLISCCLDTCGYGCQGGWAGPAWDYWREHGLVTGGSNEEGDGCQPYPFKKCGHHDGTEYPECPEMYPNPECSNQCQKDYITPYEKDKIYATVAYNVMDIMENIQQEMLIYGPVEACFTIYADFLNYKSGVYQHIHGDTLGGHCVRIIGWGSEDDIPYWLVANSWNDGWGDNGLFKILRGSNECGIEGEVVAGIPFID